MRWILILPTFSIYRRFFAYAELRRLAGNAEAERDGAQRVLANLERKIAGIVKAIEDGAYHPTLKDRLATLEKETEAASARLAAVRPEPVLRLHPGLPALYKKKVENLAAALNEPGTAADAGEIMRGLIDRIVLTPAGGILKAKIYGDLASLMNFADAQEPTTKSAGSAGDPALLSVVAGTCNWLDLLLRADMKPALAPWTLRNQI